jgi:FkbH-like protein
VDDSSFEINYIREQLPEIVSLQVPSTISEYPDYLLKHTYKYFNLSLVEEDSLKTAIYKQQFQRESDRNKYETIDEYLASLKMIITIYKDEPSYIQRIAQLTQKTNQFNLTTKRYTENQILKFMENSDDHVFAVSVKDKFGDNGLTAVAIITTDNKNRNNVSIDTFLMSCRIIGRNIEYAFMDYIVQWLKQKPYLILHGEFIPTKKNGQVIRFYEDIGFVLLTNTENIKQYSINILDYKMNNIEYIKLEPITNTKNPK